MVKRNKRLSRAIEAYKKEIEKHFEKLDQDIMENDELTAEYHIKEIDKSLITGLEKKLNLLGEMSELDEEFIKRLREKLEDYKKKLSLKD